VAALSLAAGLSAFSAAGFASSAAAAECTKALKPKVVYVYHYDQDFASRAVNPNARAQGIPDWRVVCRYALRNAMIPTLTMIGLRYGWMLGSTILVESVFDWPGIGLYAVNSALSSDFQPVMGVTLLIGLNFMIANLLVDLAYGWLDPRVRQA